MSIKKFLIKAALTVVILVATCVSYILLCEVGSPFTHHVGIVGGAGIVIMWLIK